MRVLSIDLDYIIEPSDPLFRDWAHHNNPMVRWDAFYSTTKHKKMTPKPEQAAGGMALPSSI